MTTIDTIQAVSALAQSAPSEAPLALASPSPSSSNFGDLLAGGVNAVDDRVGAAQDMVRAFAIDSSIPIHQVTIALEEARLAVELAMQVRTRLVEGYREIMNTQL